jgi:pyruvate/2-oxoglutarate dehydrogenase complex dihydrolipoamide dehydrogenase (E3) component
VFTTGALQQFVALHHQRVGTRAVVVGAEHVSFSAVLTLQHAGCAVVALTTPLPRHQTHAPLEWATTRRRRVPVLTGVDVAEVVGRTRVEGVVLTDGRTLACDTVVFTGDWIPEHELARRAGLPMLAGARAPVIDPTMHTEHRGVFAIGNVAHPAETADVCALDGRHVAPSVVDWLSLGRWPDHVTPITVVAPISWASYDSRGITLRMSEPVDGRIRLTHSGEVQWISDDGTWLPNRSITIRTDAMKTTPRPYADHRLHVDVLR